MLSLALIVKNEEKNLPRILDSAAGLGYTELVIIDTGSTDKTVEIAKQYTDKVYYFEWVKHFAHARNFCFSKCTQEWVMWLDADDYLQSDEVPQIRKFFEENAKRVDIDYMVMNYHYWVDPPTPDGEVKATQLRERIVRRSIAKWIGRCHEIIPVLWGRSVAFPKELAVWHLRSNEDRVADGDRNIELMKLAVAEDPTSRNYYYLGDEYTSRGYAKDAIAAYRNCFLKQDSIDLCFQAAYKIAKIYHGLKKQDKALYWYKKSLDFQVDYREPLIAMAEIFRDKNDHSKVVFWLEAALKIQEPAHPVMVIVKENYTWLPYDRLAKAYFAMGAYTKAQECSEKLFEFMPQAGILNDIELSKMMRREKYKRPDGPVRLNLGSGGKTIPGFINCDLYPQLGVDEVFSMEEIPYADKTVDEISSEHALEHLPRLAGERAIKEFARVLKKGGKLNLKVPDLEDCCRKFLEHPHLQERWYLHTLYGVQDYRDVPSMPFKDKVNYGQIHYTGFTESRLRRLLTGAGFVIDKLYKYDGFDTPSLAVEAHIPNLSSEQVKKVAFINTTLIPKYLSYGDYWQDAFQALGHQVAVYKYTDIPQLTAGYDLYFFIEADYRYDPASIPSVSPKVLYTQENPPLNQLKLFDLVLTPDSEKARQWAIAGISTQVLPNSNHLHQVAQLLGMYPDTCRDNNVETTVKLTDIIIPSYKNLKYLRLCIDSVRRNTTNYNLIVVNSGDDQEVRTYLQQQSDIRLIDSVERKSFSQAVNIGLRATVNDVVILNNDTVVGVGWLDAFKQSPFDITNPFSNCDAQWIHNLYPIVGGTKLHPNMFIGDVDYEAIVTLQSPYQDIVPRNKPGQSWVAFYATHIKRKVINATGLLDETFINGGEDYDYCRRAVKQGFNCGHTFASWVFHFGGKTRKVSEEENFIQHHKEDELNNTYMRFKDRETICIHTGPAFERWTVETINTTGIGGSETCAALLAKEFVKKGYRTVIIGDCREQEGQYDGVEYIDYSKWERFKETNYIDYFISSRRMSPLAHIIKNGKNYVWSHDIFIPECANNRLTYEDRVTKFVCLSPWHVDFFSQHHQVDKSRIYIQGNGLDVSRYANAPNVEKDPYRLIYSSSPDRGLLTLLQQFKVLKKEFPALNLHIFYGFYNWKQAIEQRKNPQEINHVRQIEQLMEQDGVVYHGRVSQKQLAEEQMKSTLWVYPTWFTETYCITSNEAMLAGAVPVCTTLAALQTTVPDNCGIKVAAPEECLDATRQLLKQPSLLENYRRNGREHVLRNCNWDVTADNWIQMFKTT